MIKNTGLIFSICHLPSGRNAIRPDPPIIDKCVMVKSLVRIKGGFASLKPD